MRKANDREAALSMRETSEKTAILLDRHPLWLDAMETLVNGLGIVVVGRATTGDDAVDQIEDLRPDLLIAGIDLVDSEELACITRAMQAHPSLRSVVVADSDDPEAVGRAFGAGASAYCVKTAEQDDLASAIRQMFGRSIYLAGEGFAPPAPVDPRAESAARELTRRELEILRLVAEGYSNSQLAKMLWVTEQTVKFHLSNIYRKLDVANRTEASRWAQLNGLLPAQREPTAAAAV
jgi:DNA-binding NarL/FixJ family response regulator